MVLDGALGSYSIRHYITKCEFFFELYQIQKQEIEKMEQKIAMVRHLPEYHFIEKINELKTKLEYWNKFRKLLSENMALSEKMRDEIFEYGLDNYYEYESHEERYEAYEKRCDLFHKYYQEWKEFKNKVIFMEDIPYEKMNHKIWHDFVDSILEGDYENELTEIVLSIDSDVFFQTDRCYEYICEYIQSVMSELKYLKAIAY